MCGSRRDVLESGRGRRGPSQLLTAQLLQKYFKALDGYWIRRSNSGYEAAPPGNGKISIMTTMPGW